MVPGFDRTIMTPGIAAPDASWTYPVMEPVPNCAKTGNGRHNNDPIRTKFTTVTLRPIITSFRARNSRDASKSSIGDGKATKRHMRTQNQKPFWDFYAFLWLRSPLGVSDFDAALRADHGKDTCTFN